MLYIYTVSLLCYYEAGVSVSDFCESSYEWHTANHLRVNKFPGRFAGICKRRDEDGYCAVGWCDLSEVLNFIDDQILMTFILLKNTLIFLYIHRFEK